MQEMQKPQWNKLTTREANDEEKADGYTFMWDGAMPEIGETVIVTDGDEIYMREWQEFDVGVGFEDIDPPLWWMSLPELPKKYAEEFNQKKTPQV